MDRSQIIPRGHTYLTVVCVVLLAFTLLVAGCTGKDATSPATSAPSAAGTSSVPGEGVQDGDLVEIEYIGTLANGSVFDSSKDRGPFQFIVGTGSAITGFDNEVRGMKVGQNKKFTLTPDMAYGDYDPSLIQSMPIDFIPPEENVTIGDMITLFNGQAYFPATIVEINATNVTFDLNHQLAGQSLTFEVTLVNLTPSKEVEAMMAQFAQEESLQIPALEEEVTPADSTIQNSDMSSSGNATS
jgi:FKBP-type peptidyl-prolyl cis-trans isomerase 2